MLQSLDTLGAGFQLASHDLDIRGAGNLLGDEQSGHIKEVGFELYQQMLEEAVRALEGRHRRAGGRPLVAADHHRHAGAHSGRTTSPTCRLRLGALSAPRRYRRGRRDIEAFGAELVDRFGPLPNEVEHLLKIVAIKALCREPNVEKVEAGPKGVVL